MNDVRAQAKAFYNALDLDKPINFGQELLIRNERAQPKYVLQYRNGEDWFAVHPLLREELGLG